MPFKIQRVARGLQNLLSLSGGDGPRELEDRVRPIIDLLQLYGQSQKQILTASGTPAEAAPVSLTTPTDAWCVLFNAAATATKTATMTALRVQLWVDTIAVASVEGGPFGATETGGVACPFVPPYPWILPPGTGIFATCPIIGTDATAALGISARIGVLNF